MINTTFIAGYAVSGINWLDRVSLPWVVRDAIDEYLKSIWPLLLQCTNAQEAKQRSEEE
jgi:hypothetical protein